MLEPFIRSPGGRRLLRASLLQPSRSVSTIEARSAAIGELWQREAPAAVLATVLRTMPLRLDRMLIQLSSGVTGEGPATIKRVAAAISAVMQLRDLLRWLQARPVAARVYTTARSAIAAARPACDLTADGWGGGLCLAPQRGDVHVHALTYQMQLERPRPNAQSVREPLAPFEAALLASIRDSAGFTELAALLGAVDQVLDTEAEQGRAALDGIQQCYVVRDGVCAFLDAARARFNALSEQVASQARHLGLRVGSHTVQDT